MTDTELTVTRRVPAPRARVWDAFTDLTAMPQMISGIAKVEPLSGHDRIVPGARWRETRVMFGREATEEMEVVEVVDGQRYVVVAESAGTRYESTFAFADAGQVGPDGAAETDVTLTFDAHAQTMTAKLMQRVMGGMGRRAVEKAIRQDLDDVAASFA